jgi:hypothetical protein
VGTLFRTQGTTPSGPAAYARNTHRSQKRLDDLALTAGVTLEWKMLLRDLDRLQQLRIHHRQADWLVRTDISPALAAVFRCAKIALLLIPT